MNLNNLNRKLIIVLNFLSVVLNRVVGTNKNVDFNSNSNPVQSILRLNGGSKNKMSESISNGPPQQSLKQTITRSELL